MAWPGHTGLAKGDQATQSLAAGGQVSFVSDLLGVPLFAACPHRFVTEVGRFLRDFFFALPFDAWPRDGFSHSSLIENLLRRQ